jgi:hypothetical protein
VGDVLKASGRRLPTFAFGIAQLRPAGSWSCDFLPGLLRLECTALQGPTRKATASAASLRSGPARVSRAVIAFCGSPTAAPRRQIMIEVYSTTLALITEIKPAMLVRWLAAFHVVVDVHGVDDGAIRLWLDNGDTITLGPTGLVEAAQ